MELAEIIRRRKGKRNVREFAQALGVSHQTVYNAIRGFGNPSYKLLKALGLIKSVRANGASEK